MRFPLIYVTILVSFLFQALPAMDFYVSPAGFKEADGSVGHPFKLEQVRMAASTFLGKEEVNIWLMDGVYYLERPLVFGPEGMIIDQLFIDDRRQEMARFPNSMEDRNVFDHWILSHSAQADPENDPLSPDRISAWNNPSGAYLHAMHRGTQDDEKWGKEIDYNVFTSSHADRLLFASNDCDAHSIVADPGFRDPESGDFTVALDSPVSELGFRYFDMSSFGVISPRLRTMVKSPVLPVPQIKLIVK